MLNNLNVVINKVQDWQELTKLTQGRPIAVERVRLGGSDTAIEGGWELPQLARLSAEDQVFITAFVRSHGSIKEMEQVFGVSYPTIKGRSRASRTSSSLWRRIPRRRATRFSIVCSAARSPPRTRSKNWRA